MAVDDISATIKALRLKVNTQAQQDNQSTKSKKHRNSDGKDKMGDLASNEDSGTEEETPEEEAPEEEAPEDPEADIPITSAAVEICFSSSTITQLARIDGTLESGKMQEVVLSECLRMYNVSDNPREKLVLAYATSLKVS